MVRYSVPQSEQCIFVDAYHNGWIVLLELLGVLCVIVRAVGTQPRLNGVQYVEPVWY